MKQDVSLFRVGQIWHYRFTVDGKRTQRSTREGVRNVAATVAEEAFTAAKLRARGLEPEPTLGALVDLWVVAHVLILSDDRIRSVENFAKLHFGTLKDLQLQELTTKRVEDARLEYLKDHKESSANGWLACLRALLGWAIKRQMIRYGPWQVGKLKVQRKPKVLLPSLKAADWMAAVEGLAEKEPGIAMVIKFMAGLGLRISEALDARWEWLDFERETYTPGITKGKEAWPRPVSPWLLEQLRPCAQLMGSIIALRPGHPITDGRVAYLMKLANRETGVLNVTPHRLRGTYATWLLEMGVPIQDVRQAMGHKSIMTTAGYLEVDLGRVAKAQISIGHRLGMAGREKGEPRTATPHQSDTQEFQGRIPESEGK